MSIGCRPAQAVTSLAEQLKGRWQLRGEPRAPSNRIEFRQTSDTDGTFEYTIPSIVTLTFRGTWHLEGRTLTWRFREVPDLARWGEQLGAANRLDTMTFTIVRISNNELVLQQPRVATEERYERIAD